MSEESSRGEPEALASQAGRIERVRASVERGTRPLVRIAGYVHAAMHESVRLTLPLALHRAVGGTLARRPNRGSPSPLALEDGQTVEAGDKCTKLFRF